MVDDQSNAWLIEINSSPACDYSTKTTERYVQKALVEMLSVVLDTREYEKEKERRSKRKSKKKVVDGDEEDDDDGRPDTGGWERIYKGPLLESAVASFGAEMELKGNAMKVSSL